MKKKRKFLLTESMSAIIIQEERQIFTTEFRCKIINEKKILQTGSRGVNMWEEKQTKLFWSVIITQKETKKITFC